jgi:hypothetical protein
VAPFLAGADFFFAAAVFTVVFCLVATAAASALQARAIIAAMAAQLKSFFH